jgi:hypothetical protein
LEIPEAVNSFVYPFQVHKKESESSGLQQEIIEKVSFLHLYLGILLEYESDYLDY